MPCSPIRSSCNPQSHIGTPGLAEALRHGSASLVNALGSGILETRAFLAFLPKLSRVLLGEELQLPSIATWWCGQAKERRHVIDNIERMMVGPALSTRLPFEDEQATVLGESLDPAERAALIERLTGAGAEFVGQEAVTLSTTPVYAHGRLEPRPASLRVYLARTAEGWTVMPGGFARVGLTGDTTALAMQRGGQAADVWVVSPSPVDLRDAAARRARRLHPPGAGQPAEPGGRKPRLARPLCRALGGHGAHPARLSRAACRDLGSRAAAAGRDTRLSGAARHRRQCGDPARPGLDLRPRGLQRRADPRPLLAGRLAGAATTCRRPCTNSRTMWRRATTRPAP